MDIKIRNMQDYGKECKYIVTVVSAMQLWFYGAYNDLDKAQLAARECSGIVLVNNLEVN